MARTVLTRLIAQWCAQVPHSAIACGEMELSLIFAVGGRTGGRNDGHRQDIGQKRQSAGGSRAF
jgi:hypothetical protein